MPVGRRILTIHDAQPLDLSPQVFYLPDPNLSYALIGGNKGAAGFDASLSKRLTYADDPITRFGLSASWTCRFEILFRGAAIGADVRPICRGVSGRDIIVRKVTTNTMSFIIGNPAPITVVNSQVIADSIPYVVTIKHDFVTHTVTLTVATSTSSVTGGTNGNVSSISPYTVPSDVFSLGGTALAANLHTGWIANLAFWDRLTTAAEDLAMLNLGRGFIYSDVASVAGLSTGLRYWFPLGTNDGGSFLGERVTGISLTNVNSVAEENGTLMKTYPNDLDALGYVGNPGTLSATVYGQQPATANRPFYRTNGGLPYIQLQGSAWISNGTDIGLAHTTQMYIGMLIRNPVFTDGMELFGRRNATEGWGWAISGNDIVNKSRSVIAGQWTGAKQYLTDGNWHWVELIRKDNSYILLADGEVKASAIASTLNATAGLTHFLGKATSGGTPLVADVACYFERDTAMSSLELAQLRRWVEKRFLPPLMKTAGQPARTRAYSGGSSYNLASPSTYLSLGGKLVTSWFNTLKQRVHDNDQAVIDEISFHTNAPTSLPWYACILTPKIATQNIYTLQRVSDPFYLTSAGQQIVTLGQPLKYKDGDRLGILVPVGGTLGVTTTGSNPLYTYTGLPTIGVETIFPLETTGQNLIFFSRGSGAKVGKNGDSNGCGRPPGTDLGGEYMPHYQIQGALSTTFDPSANCLRRCASKDPRISIVEYSLGGQTTAWGISTGLPDLIAAYPDLKVYIIALGSNNIYLNSDSAATVVAGINTLITNARAAWTNIPIIVFGMYPFNAMSDAQAQIGLDTDAALVTLCAGLTDVTYFDVRSRVGKPRTSMAGNPLCSYVDIWQRGDDLHLNGLGQEQLAISLTPILQNKLGFV